jgi:hypothetical protein
VFHERSFLARVICGIDYPNPSLPSSPESPVPRCRPRIPNSSTARESLPPPMTLLAPMSPCRPSRRSMTVARPLRVLLGLLLDAASVPQRHPWFLRLRSIASSSPFRHTGMSLCYFRFPVRSNAEPRLVMLCCAVQSSIPRSAIFLVMLCCV